jgi:hypothetical protein
MPPRQFDPFKPWWNAWFLTFNTNQTNPELVYPLSVVYEYFVTHIAQFVKPKPGVRILKVEQNSSIEQGGKYHRYHIHAVLAVRSTGLLDLDYYKISEFFGLQLSQVPGFKTIAFHHRIFEGYNKVRNAQEYLNKAPIPIQRGRSTFRII